VVAVVRSFRGRDDAVELVCPEVLFPGSDG
jgi:hypothetical protein